MRRGGQGVRTSDGRGPVCSTSWPLFSPGGTLKRHVRCARTSRGGPRRALRHRTPGGCRWHGDRIPRTGSQARSRRRLEGAAPRARRRARDRALPERDPGDRPPAAPAHPAVVRFRPGGRPDLLCDAARGRRIAAAAARARETAPDRRGAQARRRRRQCARLRASPRRGPPRHQAGEYPVPGRPGSSGGLRDRARPLRRGRLAPDGNGAVPRHAAIHEPGAGDGGPPHRRAERHLLPRLGPVRDARRRAAAHRTDGAVGDRQGPDGPTATAATTAGVRSPARRGRGPEGAGQSAGGPVPDRGGVRGRAGAAGVGARDAGASRSVRAAGCRALGGRRARDRPRALGLAPSAIRAPCTAGGAVHAGPAAERATGRGGPDRRVVSGWVTDRVCQLRSHRKSAVQPQARPAGARAPRRYADRAEPVLLPGRTMGGVLLERQAVQAAAGWGASDHGRGCARPRFWSDVGVDRHDCVSLGLGPDGRARRGGEPRLLLKSDTSRGETYSFPHYLPGAKALLFQIRSRGVDRLGALTLATGKLTRFEQTGSNPQYVSSGYVVLATRTGRLLAVPFDPSRLEITGSALPVAEGVVVGPGGGARMGMSRDGAFAYVSGAMVLRELVMVDRSGSARPLPAEPQGYVAPRISPDGRRIAVEVDDPDLVSADVWVYDIAHHTRTRLTFDQTGHRPIWTPDGRRIVYSRGQFSQADLYWIPADGSGPAESLLVAPDDQWAGAVTPDGRTLLFRAGGGGPVRSIYTLSLEGPRTPQPFLANQFENHSPALSPDGHWVAYVSNELGRVEVYVRPFPGPGGRG